MTLDPPARYLITKSMVDHGDMQMRLDEDDPVMMARYNVERFPGPDGNYYSAYFSFGQALIFIPHYIILHHLLGIRSDKIILAVISATLFPLTLALTAVAFFALMRQFRFSPKQSYLAAALLIFATGLWQVSKEGQEDSQLALFFTLIAYSLRRYQNTGSFKMLALSALLMGFCYWIRSDIAPTVLCYTIFAACLIYQNNRPQIPSPAARPPTKIHYLVVLIILFLFFLVHAYVEYSHYGKLGGSYDIPFAWSNLSLGLPGLLFSPGKGMFIYNPFFILALMGLIPLWRTSRAWVVFIMAAFSGCLLLHAMLSSFHGNWCWGPRYLCRHIPLLFIAAAFFGFRRPASAQAHAAPVGKGFSQTRRIVFNLVISLSLLVQIAAVSGNHSRELTDMAYQRGGWSVHQWTMFEPEAHILKSRLINLRNGVKDMINGDIPPWPNSPKRLRTPEENINAPVLHYLAFWPFHLTYYLPALKPRYALPLWASTALLIAGLLCGCYLLYRGYPSRQKP
ncbi:MAG: hypothetical protein AMJ79_14425 [Phycisphaerae bacterium SM23_30]|nr:MAG: hypothetical protein AMJ79_14425 [Phycisphaerae bacterium SM23_30]